MKDGNCSRLYGSFQDITEKVKKQQAIDEERALLKTLVNNLPLNIFIKNLDSKKTLINNKELEYIGFSNENEVLGKSDFDLYPYQSALISIQEDQQVINSGISIIDKETFNTKRDGKGTWFLTSKIPLLNAENKISGILGISYDITKRKMAEEKLKVSEERFKLIFESFISGIALLNPADGSFIDLNLAIATMFGYTKTELMQLHLKNISHPNDMHLNINNEESNEMKEGKIKSLSVAKRYIHKDGHTIWTKITTTMARDKADNPLYVLFHVQEIENEKLI